MQRDDEIDMSVRKITTTLILNRARARGWHVIAFKTARAMHLLEIPGRNTPVKICSASPPQLTMVATKMSTNKFIANTILGMNNDIPLPEDKLVNMEQPLDEQGATEFLQKHGMVVIKPLDASHGNGITTNVTTMDQLAEACNEAVKHSDKNYALIQQQVDGNDLRMICIGYEFAAAITRIPARVTGDGQHTISELIDIENTQDYRSASYHTRLNFINKDRAAIFLGEDRLYNEVPEAGQYTRVMGVANIGMGGEREVVTDRVPRFMIDLAVTAAKILELPVCAVDFMTATSPQLDQTIDELKPYLIELNSCPQLLIYDDPNCDEQNVLIDKYLDFVASYPPIV